MNKKYPFAGIFMNYYRCLACGEEFMNHSDFKERFCYLCLNFDPTAIQLIKQVPGSYYENDIFERVANLGLLAHARKTYLLMEQGNASQKELDEMLDILIARNKIKIFWDNNPHPTEDEYDAFFYQKGIAKYCMFPTTTDKRYMDSIDKK